MTQERFFQIADDPELLRRITYEELKTLALAYPYAHNLRTMLAIKASQVDHPESAKTLATAAAYGLDRTRLFLLAAPQAIAPMQVLAPEETLELKPIETVKRELEALAPVAREEEAVEEVSAMAEPIPPPPLAPPTPELPEHESPEPESTPPPVLDAQPYLTYLDWFSQFRPPLLERAVVPAVADVEEPNLEVPEPEKVEEKIPPAPKTAGIAQQLAERSVAENQDVISETLAKLYAKQGYRDKAAQMYARLALLFPEKSPYFAAEIEKLKK